MLPGLLRPVNRIFWLSARVVTTADVRSDVAGKAGFRDNPSGNLLLYPVFASLLPENS